MRIIIIHDHGPIDDCLSALCNAPLPDGARVTVIDNVASTHDWEALFARLISHCEPKRAPVFEVIRNPQRMGFSANNNQVLLKMDDDCALLLNDDALVLPGAIGNLLRDMRAHPDAALIGAQLLNEDGSIQPSFFTFPHIGNSLRNAWLGIPALHRTPHEWARGAAYPVDWVTAACVLVRYAALQEVGMLDVAYDPGYGEDMDWAWRFQQAHWHVLACPTAQATHLIGQSFGLLSAARYRQAFLGLTRFLVTHYCPLKALMIRIIWCVGLSARAMLSTFISMLRPHQSFPDRTAYLAALRAVIWRS